MQIPFVTQGSWFALRCHYFLYLAIDCMENKTLLPIILHVLKISPYSFLQFKNVCWASFGAESSFVLPNSRDPLGPGIGRKGFRYHRETLYTNHKTATDAKYSHLSNANKMPKIMLLSARDLQIMQSEMIQLIFSSFSSSYTASCVNFEPWNDVEMVSCMTQWQGLSGFKGEKPD